MLEHTDVVWLDLLLTVLIAVVASSGFWAWVMSRGRRKDEIDEQRQMQVDLLRGLAHDRIVYLATKYIERGWIGTEEYENLHEYLYKPYKAMQGNGSAARLMEMVQKLPTRPSPYDSQHLDKE